MDTHEASNLSAAEPTPDTIHGEYAIRQLSLQGTRIGTGLRFTLASEALLTVAGITGYELHGFRGAGIATAMGAVAIVGVAANFFNPRGSK